MVESTKSAENEYYRKGLNDVSSVDGFRFKANSSGRVPKYRLFRYTRASQALSKLRELIHRRDHIGVSDWTGIFFEFLCSPVTNQKLTASVPINSHLRRTTRTNVAQHSS